MPKQPDLRTVSDTERFFALREVVDQLWPIMDRLHRDPVTFVQTPEFKRFVAENYTRVHWLYYDAFLYDGFTRPIEPYNPERIGFPTLPLLRNT